MYVPGSGSSTTLNTEVAIEHLSMMEFTVGGSLRIGRRKMNPNGFPSEVMRDRVVSQSSGTTTHTLIAVGAVGVELLTSSNFLSAPNASVFPP